MKIFRLANLFAQNPDPLMSPNLFFENVLKIAKYLYFTQISNQEVGFEHPFYMLLINAGDLEILLTDDKLKDIPIYKNCDVEKSETNEHTPYKDMYPKYMSREDELSLTCIENYIYMFFDEIRENYRKKIIQYLQLMECQTFPEYRNFFSKRSPSINTIKIILNLLYEDYLLCSSQLRSQLFDFLYQIFFSTYNIRQIILCYNDPDKHKPYISVCRLFITFIELLEFSYISSENINFISDFLMDVNEDCEKLFEIFSGFFSKYTNCIIFLKKILPQKIFSGLVLIERIHSVQNSSILVFPGNYIPIFQITKRSISSFLQENRANKDLFHLKYFIFMKKKSSYGTFEMLVTFSAFDKIFSLSSIQIMNEKTSNLMFFKGKRRLKFKRIRGKDKTQPSMKTKISYINQIITDSDAKTVFFHYDIL